MMRERERATSMYDVCLNGDSYLPCSPVSTVETAVNPVMQVYLMTGSFFFHFLKIFVPACVY